MAKATLAVQMKSNTSIEVRISGKAVKAQTQRYDFANAEEANAAMLRAVEWGLQFARTGVVA